MSTEHPDELAHRRLYYLTRCPRTGAINGLLGHRRSDRTAHRAARDMHGEKPYRLLKYAEVSGPLIEVPEEEASS